MEMFAPVILLS